MTSKGIITSAQEAIVAVGKSAAEGAKALAGEVANAAATAKAASTTAASVVLDKVATAIEAKRPIITSVQETVVGVWVWHLADIRAAISNVRFWG